MKARRWEQWFPNRGLAISLLVLLTAAFLAGGYLLYAVLTQQLFVRRATEGVRVAFVLDDLYLHLQTAESATRGYLLSGDTTYLQPYDQAKRDIPQRFQQLSNSPALQQYRPEVAQLQKSVNERMRLLQAGIERRQNQSLSDFTATANFDRGKAAMEAARTQLHGLSSRVLLATEPDQRRANNALVRTQLMLPVVLLIVLAVCIIISRYYTKGIETERSIEGSKNEFLSLASHQLRTPATNVKQYIHLVLDGYFGEVTPDQRTALETASRNNDIEINIINELLDVAKVDLNQIMITLEPHDAGALVKQVTRDFKAPLKKRHQKLQYQVAKRRPRVCLDPTYFKSVVENLIDNASKYSPQHSTITLQEEFVGSRYVLTVADKGVGIPRHQQHRLFKKFSRIPNELSAAVEGSGLGLYWVKRMVELHHGTIKVESKPGQGSRFMVSLPVASTTQS